MQASNAAIGLDVVTKFRQGLWKLFNLLSFRLFAKHDLVDLPVQPRRMATSLNISVVKLHLQNYLTSRILLKLKGRCAKSRIIFYSNLW
jgi:hypothetical protein